MTALWHDVRIGYLCMKSKRENWSWGWGGKSVRNLKKFLAISVRSDYNGLRGVFQMAEFGREKYGCLER